MGETEEMYTIGRPCTLRDEVVEDVDHDLESWRWVRPLDDLAEGIKGRVPLKGLFVEVWDPVGDHLASLVDLGERARLLVGGTQCENGCLRKMEGSTELGEWCVGVPCACRGIGDCAGETTEGVLTESMEKDEQVLVRSIVAGYV